MEFSEKLQSLRKQKGLTQDDLAKKLFVSRTAVSKWESGRGYPNLNSLVDIAKVFSVSIDELLKSNELIVLTKKESSLKQNALRLLFFGLLDITVLLALFLPIFALRSGGIISEVSLLNLTNISPLLRLAYFVSLISVAIYGVLEIVLRKSENTLWTKLRYKISISVSGILLLLFIISMQVSVAVLLFMFTAIKILTFIK